MNKTISKAENHQEAGSKDMSVYAEEQQLLDRDNSLT